MNGELFPLPNECFSERVSLPAPMARFHFKRREKREKERGREREIGGG